MKTIFLLPLLAMLVCSCGYTEPVKTEIDDYKASMTPPSPPKRIDPKSIPSIDDAINAHMQNMLQFTMWRIDLEKMLNDSRQFYGLSGLEESQKIANIKNAYVEHEYVLTVDKIKLESRIALYHTDGYGEPPYKFLEFP